MGQAVRESGTLSFGYEWTSMAYPGRKCGIRPHLHHLYTGHRGGFPDPSSPIRGKLDGSRFAVIMRCSSPCWSSDPGDGHNLPISVYTKSGSASDCLAAKKCHPDRRIRPGLPGCRQIDRRIGDRRRTRTSPPDPDDLFAFILGTFHW